MGLTMEMRETPINVLLIEDNPSDARLLEELLRDEEALPFIVEHVDGLAPAFTKLTEAAFDLILLDLTLRESDGIDTVRRVLAYTKEIPVVIITAWDDAKLAVQAVEAGAQDYLVKDHVQTLFPVSQLYHAIVRHKLQRAAEEAVQVSEARLHHLMTTCPAVIYSRKASGSFMATFVSENVEALLGFRPETFLQDPDFWAGRLYPEDAPRVFRERLGLVEKGRFTCEYRFRHADGAYRWIHDRMRLVRSKGGRPVAVVGSWEDFTERRQAEESLKQYAADLERSNQELEQFAYLASHDLQEPLRKIQAFSDRIASRYAVALDARGIDYFQRIQMAGARMQQLVEDLLSLSRVNSRRHSFVETDLNAVVQEVLSDLEGPLEQTGGKVDVAPLPIVAADPLQMRQLFQNLIGNALKFHREGVSPSVRVHSRALGESREGGSRIGDSLAGESLAGEREARPACEIRIEDNGVGFEQQYVDRIFKPFQRLHGRGEYAGTGIGLAVCRKIAERHGGAITAQSTPGQGSTFTVVLSGSDPSSEHGARPIRP